MTKQDKMKQFEALLFRYREELSNLQDLITKGVADDYDHDKSAATREQAVKLFADNVVGE